MVLVDGRHIATGKAAIREVLQGMLTKPNLKTHWAPIRIEVAKSGDLAYEVGTGTISTTDPKGNIATWLGKYVFVWRKQPNGNWRVAVDMSNSDGV
jgi:ketosteroid isomerase-like protein